MYPLRPLSGLFFSCLRRFKTSILDRFLSLFLRRACEICSLLACTSFVPNDFFFGGSSWKLTWKQSKEGLQLVFASFLLAGGLLACESLLLALRPWLSSRVVVMILSSFLGEKDATPLLGRSPAWTGEVLELCTFSLTSHLLRASS